MAAPTPLRDPDDDVIRAGTLRLTWISGLVAAIVAVGATWSKLWKAVYDDDPSNWVKTAVLITVIASWAVIAAVDLAARAYATAHARGATESADPVWEVVALAKPQPAELTQAEGDTLDVLALATRFRAAKPAEIDFLIRVPNGRSEWVDGTRLKLK